MNVSPFHPIPGGKTTLSVHEDLRDLAVTTLAPTPENVEFWYTSKYRIIGTIFNLLILIIGLFGNVLVVVIVRSDKVLHSTTNAYLVSLAIGDTLSLISTVPYELISYYVAINKFFTTGFGCLAHIFAYNVGMNVSALSLVALTLERYFCVCHPMKAYSRCTMARAKKIIASIWFVTITYCAPWVFLVGFSPVGALSYPDPAECEVFMGSDKLRYIYVLDLIVFYMIPMILSCCAYFRIGRVMLASRYYRTSEGRLEEMSTSVNGRRRQRAVKMLAIVIAVFATLWFPYKGLLVYNSFASVMGSVTYNDLWFLMFAKTCIYINCAINPVLYNIMSLKFRHASRKIMQCFGIEELRYFNWQRREEAFEMKDFVTVRPRRSRRLARRANVDVTAV